MVPVGNADQLSGNSQMIAVLANAAFQHSRDIQLFSNLPHVLGFPLECKNRCSGNDAQTSDFRQFGY